MNTGRPCSLSIMDFLPWTTFTRIVDRYGERSPGPDAFVRRAIPIHGLRPADLPGKPARHRDLPLGPRIETLSHGLPPAGPALDAGRCQRKARLAYPCGVGLSGSSQQARTLYADEELGLDLTNTVYAQDSTTIKCLSVFPWAHFRTTKAAVKIAHAARPMRGNIPSFIHISDGKLHDVLALDMRLAGSRSHLRRGSWLRRLCPPLCTCTKPGPDGFVTRAKSNIDAHRVYSAPTDRSTGIICDQTISLTASTPSGLPRTSAANPLQGPRVRQDAGLHHQQLLASGRHHLRALQKPLAGGTLLQVDQAASSDQAVLRHVGERGEDADLDCRLRSTSSSPSSRSASTLDASLYTLLQILSVTLTRKCPVHQALRETKTDATLRKFQPIEFIRF